MDVGTPDPYAEALSAPSSGRGPLSVPTGSESMT
jgi:hypothetical protein